MNFRLRTTIDLSVVEHSKSHSWQEQLIDPIQLTFVGPTCELIQECMREFARRHQNTCGVISSILIEDSLSKEEIKIEDFEFIVQSYLDECPGLRF